LSELPLNYSHELGDKISEISFRHFPELDTIYIRLDDIFKKYNHKENIRKDVIMKLNGANENEIKRFKNRLDQFLINLRSKEKSAIKRLWHHPIWGKVIAGLIVLLIAEIIRRVWNYFAT
jgi:hypothetical protein